MKYRRAAKVDSNQLDIVRALRRMPGVSVQTGMDDIVCGHKGKTYWFEIKEPRTVSKKTGQIIDSEIKDSQKWLRDNWHGHYAIVWNLDQILEEMGIVPGGG